MNDLAYHDRQALIHGHRYIRRQEVVELSTDWLLAAFVAGFAVCYFWF